MASDVSIVIADATRMASIRDGASVPGRIMPFTTASLGSATESIRAYRPKVVAVDAIFAEMPSGSAFLDQIEPLLGPGSKILLIAEDEGRWVTMPRSFARILTPNPRAEVVAAPRPTLVVPPPPAASTRRAPRFLVRDPLEVTVESGCATLVDISVLGAQIVSLPVLRPRQKIKVGLPEDDDTLNIVAQVAWSTFERPRLQVEPHYRVGLEFTGAAQQKLEQYRQRHCAAHPIPLRQR